MIELANVSKRYGIAEHEVVALAGIDLTIDRGAHIALCGPSGSGKSTLLHLLGCLDTPSSGSYRLADIDVARLDRNRRADLRNAKIGFVFQRFHLMPRATALENVALPLRFAGVGRRERLSRARELLARVGLAARELHRPGMLSGGEQQRVAIARALANRPELLLADEPTGNLDSKAGAEIIDLLEEQRGAGRTLIVVTHDERIAERAERVVRLLDGRIAHS